MTNAIAPVTDPVVEPTHPHARKSRDPSIPPTTYPEGMILGNQDAALRRAAKDRKDADDARRAASRQPASQRNIANFKRADADARKAKEREDAAKRDLDRSKRGW